MGHYAAIVYGMEGDACTNSTVFICSNDNASTTPAHQRNLKSSNTNPCCLYFCLQNMSYQNLNRQICSQTKHGQGCFLCKISPGQTEGEWSRSWERKPVSTAATHKNWSCLFQPISYQRKLLLEQEWAWPQHFELACFWKDSIESQGKQRKTTRRKGLLDMGKKLNRGISGTV